jgi:hypothetical protein
MPNTTYIDNTSNDNSHLTTILAGLGLSVAFSFACIVAIKWKCYHNKKKQEVTLKIGPDGNIELGITKESNESKSSGSVAASAKGSIGKKDQPEEEESGKTTSDSSMIVMANSLMQKIKNGDSQKSKDDSNQNSNKKSSIVIRKEDLQLLKLMAENPDIVAILHTIVSEGSKDSLESLATFTAKKNKGAAETLIKLFTHVTEDQHNTAKIKALLDLAKKDPAALNVASDILSHIDLHKESSGLTFKILQEASRDFSALASTQRFLGFASEHLDTIDLLLQAQHTTPPKYSFYPRARTYSISEGRALLPSASLVSLDQEGWSPVPSPERSSFSPVKVDARRPSSDSSSNEASKELVLQVSAGQVILTDSPSPSPDPNITLSGLIDNAFNVLG